MNNIMSRICGGFAMAIKNDRYILRDEERQFFKDIGKNNPESMIAAAYYCGLRDGQHWRINSRKKGEKDNGRNAEMGNS